jgi:hypothetical protein
MPTQNVERNYSYSPCSVRPVSDRVSLSTGTTDWPSGDGSRQDGTVSG